MARLELLDGILAAQGCLLVFTRDHLFTSSSMAAMAVMGRKVNPTLTVVAKTVQA